MEKHLLQHVKRRLQNIGQFVTQIERHAERVELMWERSHDPRRQDSVTSPRQFVYTCEEFKRNNIEPLRKEVDELLSDKLAKPINSRLDTILSLTSAIEQEYSKGFNQILGYEGQAYKVSKAHILDKTRGIRNNLEVINGILGQYVD